MFKQIIVISHSFNLFFIFSVALLTNAIYGSGHISSDALSWMDQMDGIKEHHNNFPSVMKLLFSVLSIYWGKVWHFNFIQNLIIYVGTYYTIFYLLKMIGYRIIPNTILCSFFLTIFFLNPYILSHTSKWYVDYIFIGILLCSFASFLSFFVNRFNLSYYLGLFLWFLAIGLRHNGPILIFSNAVILYLVLKDIVKKPMIRSISLSFIGLFSLFIISKTSSVLLDEYESYAHLTVPYFETLGLLHENPNKVVDIKKKFSDVQINLTEGLEHYHKLDCAIPALHSSSFKDVLKYPDNFQAIFWTNIVKENFYEYLIVKIKHFSFFMSSKNPCSFTHLLEPNYKNLRKHIGYSRIIKKYGEPWKCYFKQWKAWSEKSVLTLKKSDLFNLFFINLNFSTTLMITLLILSTFICRSKNKILSFIWVLVSMSISIIFSFFLANLGAFEKYRFPSLLINWICIYISIIFILNIIFCKEKINNLSLK